MIVEAVVGLFLVCVGPFGVDREREVAPAPVISAADAPPTLAASTAAVIKDLNNMNASLLPVSDGGTGGALKRRASVDARVLRHQQFDVMTLMLHR